jgi:hypothetical protein
MFSYEHIWGKLAGAIPLSGAAWIGHLMHEISLHNRNSKIWCLGLQICQQEGVPKRQESL